MILNDEFIPVATERKPSCGWRFTRMDMATGPADAMILGPNIQKTRLNIDRSIIEKWVKHAPRKSKLYWAKKLRQEPQMLLVLEEWTTPTWSHLAWGIEEYDPGPCWIGLSTEAKGAAPTWECLAVPQEPLRISSQWGNSPVLPVGMIAECRKRKIESGLLR